MIDYSYVLQIPKDAKMGQKFRLVRGCPDCGADLLVTSEVASICTNVKFKQGGGIDESSKCNHAFLAG